VQAADGHDLVALRQRVQLRLPVLLFFLLRAQDDKIERRRDGDQCTGDDQELVFSGAYSGIETLTGNVSIPYTAVTNAYSSGGSQNFSQLPG